MLLDNLVIGHSYSAVLYAYDTDSKLIINSEKQPFFFESFQSDWSNKLFEMSIAGNVLFGSAVKSVRFEDNTASITHSNQKTKVTFNKCTVFEDDNLLLQNELVNSKTMKSLVLDWVSVRSCGLHDHLELHTDSDFVNSVYFYKSNRISGNHNKKDAVCLSYLEPDQLSDFDYSDTMARFKLEQVMLDSGIKGASRGIDKRTKKLSLRKIKLEVSKREVYTNIINSYKDSEFVVFKNDRRGKK